MASKEGSNDVNDSERLHKSTLGQQFSMTICDTESDLKHFRTIALLLQLLYHPFYDRYVVALHFLGQ